MIKLSQVSPEMSSLQGQCELGVGGFLYNSLSSAEVTSLL